MGGDKINNKGANNMGSNDKTNKKGAVIMNKEIINDNGGTTMENKWNTRLSEKLHWQALKETYYIGPIRDKNTGEVTIVNTLKEAIEDGSFRALLQQDADERYGGDIGAAAARLRRNLSSKQYNLNKQAYVGNDRLRFQLLWEFTETLITKVSKVGEGLPESSKGKARWELSIEDIDAIDKDDVKALYSIYTNMASAKAKYPEAIEEKIGMAEFSKRYAYVSKLHSEAKNKAKAKEANKVDEDKLQLFEQLVSNRAGTGAPFTSEELEALRNLLGI